MTSQTAEKTFCGVDCEAKGSLQNLVLSDSDKLTSMLFLSTETEA